jgi:hypothetical protein
LLSYIADNGCYYEFQTGKGYEKYDRNNYELERSIYVYNASNSIIIYHNLENILECDNSFTVFWNKSIQDYQNPTLFQIRNQLVVYLTNSTFIPEGFLGYEKGYKTKVNLHPNSINIVASTFYKSLFGIKDFVNVKEEDDDGFASLITKNNNAQLFTGLLDIFYYQFLYENYIKNGNYNFIGKFQKEINVSFINVIRLIEYIFVEDFGQLEIKDRLALSGKDPELRYPQSKEYFNARNDFIENYSKKALTKAVNSNVINVLYFNLLFEAYFYNDDFILPDIDFTLSIYEQLKDKFIDEKYKKYMTYLNEIKELDKILSTCDLYKNHMENRNDIAFRYDKVLDFDLNPTTFKNFVNFIEKKFDILDSYVLRYIKIEPLGMSSGERAMQNMFSWLTLIPKLDKIMSIERETTQNMLLLIDEIDLYSHPEWQRRTS